ncbi:MAG: hypothetical protein ACI9S8_000719 [Chlamydiales bacterium]|jgi:hypothetical protein
MNDRFFKSLSLTFAAGCLGGLLNSLAIWISGTTELTAHFNVNIIPAMTTDWLYPRIIYGGLWGFLFLLPFLKRSYLFRGLIYSLAPSAVQLLIILPFCEHQGFLGTKLGDMTPVFVLGVNGIWGISSGLWLQYTEK